MKTNTIECNLAVFHFIPNYFPWHNNPTLLNHSNPIIFLKYIYFLCLLICLTNFLKKFQINNDTSVYFYISSVYILFPVVNDIKIDFSIYFAIIYSSFFSFPNNLIINLFLYIVIKLKKKKIDGKIGKQNKFLWSASWDEMIHEWAFDVLSFFISTYCENYYTKSKEVMVKE